VGNNWAPKKSLKGKQGEMKTAEFGVTTAFQPVLNNKVNWGVAPLVGFDVPFYNRIHDFLSLGLTAKYLITPNTPNSLSAAAALKY
jgi:hypothetical protein